LVSVLVPVLNEERWLRSAVDAMRGQDVDGEVEFLYADGGSTDRTSDILRELAGEDGRIRVLQNPRRITPSGLNVCLRHARGEYVARMDAHAFYPPDYLRLGIERLAAGDTPWVSGPVIPQPTGRVSRALVLALSSPLGQGGARKWASQAAQEEFDLDTGVFGGVWRRETVLAYGGWDERWPQNQDAEMAARFLANGHRLVCLTSMGARYIPRNTLRALFRQYGNYGFFRVATARRHPASMRRAHLVSPAVALTFGSAVLGPRFLRGPALVGVGFYVLAIGVETGRTARRGGNCADTLTMPAVLGALHLGHGVGVLRGTVHFGVPTAAIAHAAGLTSLSARLAPPAEPVQAPSLSGW